MEDLALVFIVTAVIMSITPKRYMLMISSLGMLCSTVSICMYLGTEGVSSTIATIILIILILIVFMLKFSRFGV